MLTLDPEVTFTRVLLVIMLLAAVAATPTSSHNISTGTGCFILREAAKKVLLLMAGPLKGEFTNFDKVILNQATRNVVIISI